MKNWIATNTPSQGQWITEAMEMVELENIAFRLQNNEKEYTETLAPVENDLILQTFFIIILPFCLLHCFF